MSNQAATPSETVERQEKHVEIFEAIGAIDRTESRLIELIERIEGPVPKDEAASLTDPTPTLSNVLDFTARDIRGKCDKCNDLIARLHELLF